LVVVVLYTTLWAQSARVLHNVTMRGPLSEHLYEV